MASLPGACEAAELALASWKTRGTMGKLSFLKEPSASRASWRIFLCTFHVKAVVGFVFTISSRSRLGNMVVTVLFIEAVRADLFIAAAPLSIPS